MSSKTRLRTIALTAVMTALYIVLDRYLAIIPSTAGTAIKITFAVIPLMLCGYLFGPVAGGACGLAADIIGSFLSGFAPNPLLALKPMMLGLIPGVLAVLYSKGKLPFDPTKPIAVIATVIVSEFFMSALWATYCLSMMFGAPFAAQLASRVPAILIAMVIDSVGVSLLLRSKQIRRFGAFNQKHSGK